MAASKVSAGLHAPAPGGERKVETPWPRSEQRSEAVRGANLGAGLATKGDGGQRAKGTPPAHSQRRLGPRSQRGWPQEGSLRSENGNAGAEGQEDPGGREAHRK